jgi:hypothetical protein
LFQRLDRTHQDSYRLDPVRRIAEYVYDIEAFAREAQGLLEASARIRLKLVPERPPLPPAAGARKVAPSFEACHQRSPA